ncbi:BsuPI-related putative proteinase inhibitor [Metabacillus sp. GX 13764]|uniref:BsuPI-related putative proteinase inhibitor n=1 Tax=Metabacillus kandeliae TaxID=2900151 RepID=UPI001E2DA107|nr:BsuPI-related putative proteinase inhibitor [Metabacillus kandeliae]
MDKDKLILHASQEVKEGSIIFVFTIHNPSDKGKKLVFKSGKKYEITVRDSGGKEVYRYSKGKMFTQAIEESSIQPGETLSYQEAWNYLKEGFPTGNYKAVIEFLGTDPPLKADLKFSLPE